MINIKLLTQFRRLLILALFIFTCSYMIISGCQNHNEQGESMTRNLVNINSNKSSFSRSVAEPISFVVVNINDKSIFYLDPDQQSILERYEKEEWKNLGSWFNSIAIVPVVKEAKPGDKIHIPRIMSNSEYLNIPGKYRIKTSIYLDKNLKILMPLSERVSNIFEITD